MTLCGIFLVKTERVSLFPFEEKRLDFSRRDAIILLNKTNTATARKIGGILDEKNSF